MHDTSNTAHTSPIPDTPTSAGAAGRSWHVAIHGQKQGPLDREALLAMMRARQVPADSLVWTPGMPHWQPANAFPEFASAMGVPLRVVPSSAAPAGDDAIASIVPFRNSSALVAYYLSIASLIPGLGAILGPIAILFGVKGLKFRRQNPAAHGTVHCWFAIILGGLVSLAHLTLVVLVVLSLAGVLK